MTYELILMPEAQKHTIRDRKNAAEHCDPAAFDKDKGL